MLYKLFEYHGAKVTQPLRVTYTEHAMMSPGRLTVKNSSQSLGVIVSQLKKRKHCPIVCPG